MCCLPKDLFLRLADFDSSSIYLNKMMKGMRFRVIMDGDKQLEDGVQWDYMANGGFQILISGFQITEDTLIIVQFY